MKSSKKEIITEEFDADGNLIKRIVTVKDDQQSSIELNFDRKGEAAVKVKVYEDDPELIEAKVKKFKEIASRQKTL